MKEADMENYWITNYTQKGQRIGNKKFKGKDTEL